MMINEMTPRQRWLAALDCRPVDRLPFWAKLDGAYPAAQVEPFHSMTGDAIHQWIGSHPPAGLPSGFREKHAPGFSYEHTEKDGHSREVFRTPGGELIRERVFDPPSCSWHPTRFPVCNVEDVRRLTEFLAAVTVELDADGLQQARARKKVIGESAATTVGLGESALMVWVEWLAGVENGHFLLADHPAEVATLFAQIHRILRDKFRLLAAHHPADFIWLTENTSTTLVSVAQYRELNAPHIREYAEICHAAGRRLILHMCGHLKLLLPELATMPTRGFEAFTAPPLGSATLREGRTACPDKCLIGGTHAMLWLEPAERIIAQIQTWLDELPHHCGLVLSSSGVMPPRCKPETIKAVADWLTTYPVRNSLPNQ